MTRRLSVWTKTGDRRQGAAAALVCVAALGFAAWIPWHLTSYWTTVLTTVLMLAALAQAWNLITGFAGYPAFGNIAFFGIGAYTMGVLTAKHPVHMPYVFLVLLSGLCAAAICAIVGGPLMRVKGHYFAIGTIGLAVAIQQATYLIPFLTTDVSGTIILPPFPHLASTIERTAYLWMLGVLVLAVLLTIWIARRRPGYGLRAIRADELAAATYGVPTVRLKIQAWALSAFICGLAGAVWATWIGVIAPDSSYDLTLAVQYSVIALIGGLGTVIGPLVGAILVGFTSQVVWSHYPTTHLLVMGVIVMLTVLVLPTGVVGGGGRLRESFRRQRKARESGSDAISTAAH